MIGQPCAAGARRRLLPRRRIALLGLGAWFGCAIASLSQAAGTTPGQDNSVASTSAAIAVLQVRPDVYMLTVDHVNVAVETGPDGTIVVNTGSAETGERLLTMIGKIAATPIVYVINTSADAELIGGDAPVVRAGHALATELPASAQPAGFGGLSGTVANRHVGQYAPVISTQSVLLRMIGQGGYPEWLLPSETFDRPQYQFYLNGQAIAVIRMPMAHSDGDAVVRFERSDVVVTGAVLDMEHFPVIDLQHGGSMQGEVDAVNQLLNTLVYASNPIVRAGVGTMVIPMRGPICDQADVLTYRDMLEGIRNRVQSLIDQGKDLSQVQAADPTQGYDARYGADPHGPSSAAFVEAVYKSLAANRSRHHTAQQG